MYPWEGVSKIQSIKDTICTVEGLTGQLACFHVSLLLDYTSSAVRIPLVSVGLYTPQVTHFSPGYQPLQIPPSPLV